MPSAMRFLLFRLPLALALPLPRCTVAVAGANGRVGAIVCSRLLRDHPQVTVRALVRKASEAYQGYGRLSYEVGAEEGEIDLRPAWEWNEEAGRFAAPAQVTFDASTVASYGLDRLEIRECDLRLSKEVEEAVGDVDAVIYCASSFDSFRQRRPEALNALASGVSDRAMALFELRLGDALFGKPGKGEAEAERAEEASGKTADVEGVQHVLDSLSRARKRRESLAQLTGKQERERGKGSAGRWKKG